MDEFYGKPKEVYMKKFLKDYQEEMQEFISYSSLERLDDGDRPPAYYDSFCLKIRAGKNTFMEIIFNTSNTLYISLNEKKIQANIMGKIKEFPIDTDVRDLQRALMVEEYIIDELRKLPNDQVLKSSLLNIKNLIEKDLQAMSKGTIQKLSFDLEKILPEGLFNKIMELCKFYQEKERLIIEDKIPSETKNRKYSDDPEVFKKELPHIMEKHAKAKARQAKIKARKEFLLAGFKKVKKYFQDRKLRRIEEEKILREENLRKQREQRELEKQINSAREIDF